MKLRILSSSRFRDKLFQNHGPGPSSSLSCLKLHEVSSIILILVQFHMHIIIHTVMEVEEQTHKAIVLLLSECGWECFQKAGTDYESINRAIDWRVVF